MTKKASKKWYQSKTKIGALLIGIGPLFATTGALLNGQVSINQALPIITANLGIVFGILGLRDLPFINK